MEPTQKEHPHTENTSKRSLLRPNSIIYKIIGIGILILLLLIPLNMIEDFIYERKATKRNVENEITSKWSGEQIVLGPCISIPYIQELKQKDNVEISRKTLLILPEEISIAANTEVETRKRGIYDVMVYSSDLLISGSFNMNELIKTGIKTEHILMDDIRVIMGISDLKGVRDAVVLDINGQQINFESGMPIDNLSTPQAQKDIYTALTDDQTSSPNINTGIFETGLNVRLDSSQINVTDQKEIPFSITLSLNGSQGIFFAPIGKTTKTSITSDWSTPSFGGNFLPKDREVTKDGFHADWKIIDLNRSFGQAINTDNKAEINNLSTSVFGVKFIQSTDQYQRNLRSVKYAILIVLLTFVVVFFIEMLNNKTINPFQYLLVGLALVLFYSLLLSLSEIVGFNFAYIIASIMTIALIIAHMSNILRNKKEGRLIGLLLAFLYIFVFILIQMETYALLVGSLVLFCILALIMYYSKRLL